MLYASHIDINLSLNLSTSHVASTPVLLFFTIINNSIFRDHIDSSGSFTMSSGIELHVRALQLFGHQISFNQQRMYTIDPDFNFIGLLIPTFQRLLLHLLCLAHPLLPLISLLLQVLNHLKHQLLLFLYFFSHFLLLHLLLRHFGFHLFNERLILLLLLLQFDLSLFSLFLQLLINLLLPFFLSFNVLLLISKVSP